MLTLEAARVEASRLWRAHAAELPAHDEVRGYALGVLGRPSLPSGATGELAELSRMAVKNVMPLVVDTFVQSLSVIGYRAPSANVDADVWGIWQRERMDARQAEVYRPACTYGASYLRMRDGDAGVEFHPRSPREIYAEYDQPARDAWPALALETWEVKSGSRTIREGMMFDATHWYPVRVNGSAKSSRVEVTGDPVAHGFDVVPVVRFVNDRDADDALRGEVAPLITDQRAINAVNFDRMVVSRFGAFPQKYIIGWQPGDQDPGLAQMSAMRVWAIDEDANSIKAGSFSPATVGPYNEILDEMIAHVAVKARVPVFALTGEISNVGAETVALIDAPNQRKVASKRLSFGESWEQALRKAAEVEGVAVPDDAEVVWDDTDARSFAQVVDGITKLVASGVPVRDLIDQIPGLSQVKVDAILGDLDRADAQSIATQIVDAARRPVGDAAA